MPSFDEIAGFVSNQLGAKRTALTEATTLQGELGLFGDDMDALLREYTKRFGVDMSGYLWYFHTGEEGYNFGALFYRPPNHRVAHIPITIKMLHEFAQAGRWNIQYPDHSLPPYRIDIIITWIITLTVLLSFVILLAVEEMRGW